MNKELETLTKEQLIELAEIYSTNWQACDGLWFQAVEKRQGMDGAMECDKEIWRSFTVTEAKRIKEFLGLPERAGLVQHSGQQVPMGGGQGMAGRAPRPKREG